MAEDNNNKYAVSYSYLNDDIIKEFEGVGAENLIQLLEAPDKSPLETDELIGTIFTELLLALEDGQLDSTAIINFLSMAIKQEELAEKFCQVLNVFPLTETIENLLKQLHMNQKVIKPTTLAKTLSNETISKVGIVPADSITKQLNVRKRDEFYTQKKFNLFHEEPEGFARLIVEITSILKTEDTEFQINYAVKVTNEIMGHYNLDPNRCLDIVFDCFSNNLIGNELFIIEYFKNTMWWPSITSDHSSFESLSIGGNESLAKMIGLKLVKHPKDKILPETLKLLISMLMKEGLISFGSIYKFIAADEDEMKEIEEMYNKDLEEKVFKSSANALALAAPLMDDEEEPKDKKSKTNPKAAIGEEITLEFKLSRNTEFQMLRVFLSNGLYWPSLYILTQYPFLARIDSEVNELICRLLHHMISPLYNLISCFTDEETKELQESKKVAISRMNNEVSFQDFTSVTFLSFKATIQSFSQKKFEYFYRNWNKDLPMIHNCEDLFNISTQLLKFIGVEVAKNLELFSKICDIGGYVLDNEKDNSELKLKWFTFFRNFIFPAISLIEENSIVVEKAYKILSFFPKEDRFNLYSELYQVTSKNNPLIKISYGRAEKATKDVLKRLSKETVRPMMRRIAKISFSNPLPCFLTILQQIESYDNLNSLVVETARYFNSYGWDVLTLAIMMRITASGRSNVQTNGLHERQWIQSLASFIGKICQRYPNCIDIGTLMEFLLKSLHGNDTTVLIVLKEIFMSMGGIKTITNLTLEQIYKANSGKSLQKTVYKTINDMRYDRFKSGTILIKNLVELDCINELLVLFCQVHEKLIFGEDETHLKVLANRKDDLVVVIQLFCDLVTFFGVDGSFGESLTSISNLSIDFNVPPEWSFEIWRKHLNPTNNEKISAEMAKFKSYLDSDKWNYLSIDLYGLFWQLSLYDINYVKELYDENLEKYESALSSLESAYNKSKRSFASRQIVDSQFDDLEETKTYIKDLPTDKSNHENHAAAINQRFKEECNKWFNSEEFSSQVKVFLQYCVLPRAVHSSYDAVYGAKFLFKLFEFDINNFSLIAVLDELINNNILFGSFFTSSPIESENLGLFFAEIFTILNSWRQEDKFTELPKDLIDGQGNNLTHEDYKKSLYSYQETILKDVLRALKSTDYMCRRNCITFLKNTVSVFPVVEDQCENLVEAISNIVNNEDREDLKLSGNALIGLIKSKSKEWVHLWDFIDLPEDELSAHKKKREEIMERIKQEIEAKKLKEREEREALEKAKQERLAKERAKKEEEAARLEQEKKEKRQKEAAKFNYSDESKSKGTRNEIRKEDDRGRKRYDYYSRYEKVKPGDEKGTKEEHKEVDKTKEALDTGKAKEREPVRPISAKPSLPAGPKLIEREREGTASSRPSRDARSSYIPSQPKALTPEIKEKSTRTPLAPQLSLRKEPGSSARATYDHRKSNPKFRHNGSNTNGMDKRATTSTSAHNTPPPPPPPPLPPPSAPPSNQRPGYNNKRKYDYQGGGRQYDKRQRY